MRDRKDYICHINWDPRTQIPYHIVLQSSLIDMFTNDLNSTQEAEVLGALFSFTTSFTIPLLLLESFVIGTSPHP